VTPSVAGPGDDPSVSATTAKFYTVRHQTMVRF